MQSEEYRKGYEQGIKDYAARMKKYYKHLTGHTLSAAVEYVLGLIEKEMIENKEAKGYGE